RRVGTGFRTRSCSEKKDSRLPTDSKETEMTQAAQKLPPAPSPFDSLMEITSRPPIVFTEGRGSWLRDQSGKQYLDFIQGWAVNCLGHCPDAIVSAINAQAGKLLNCSPSYYNEPMIRLADLIARH